MDKDSLKPMEWYKKAARQGVVKAQFNLRVMYDNREGVTKILLKH